MSLVSARARFIAPIISAAALAATLFCTTAARPVSAASSHIGASAITPHANTSVALSLDAARRQARTAAGASLAGARDYAQTQVQTLIIRMQILAQWSHAPTPHSATYYQALLAKARGYGDYIDAAARALSGQAIVNAHMRAALPHKAIMVSLDEQVLRAYQDGRMVLFTYITTGRPELPTVRGHFSIYHKASPVEFHSPWPPGSPYYYPPSQARYWMPFYGGYGLHDAPWRANYGPGTNVTGDGPGSGEPTGSHGCVNIPAAQAAWLWNWAPAGTAVVVY